MIKCDLCGSDDHVLGNHYEEHMNPPRTLNICLTCHSALPDHSGPKRGLRSETKEIRVFVPKSIDDWLTELVEEGELGNTKSEIVRTYLSEIKRGLIK